MADLKICPYCGEEIQASAKKCRFCGEWLTETSALTEVEKPVEVLEAQPLEVPVSSSQSIPAVNADDPNIMTVPPVSTMPGNNPTQTVMSVGGQPIILNNVVNVQQQQTVEQNVEQTVVVANSGKSESAPNWIIGEMWVIAALIGLATKSWWWFLGAGIGGWVLLMIPFIGSIMCVALGAAWGLLAGGFSAGLFSSDAAGWVVGILVGIGAIYGHLEARKAHMDELDD